MKSREAEERIRNKEEPRQGIQKYRNSRGKAKGCVRETEITGFLW